jgi:hypothetical protein
MSSGRDVHPPGTPTGTPSMTTLTVPPPGTSARGAPEPDPGTSTHPKLLTVPLTVSPCRGVSIAPKGAVEAAFMHVMVGGTPSRDPVSAEPRSIL